MPNSLTSKVVQSELPDNQRNDQSELQRLEQRQMYQYQTMGDELYLDEASYDNTDDNDFDLIDIEDGEQCRACINLIGRQICVFRCRHFFLSSVL